MTIEKKITIYDIAQAAGASASTVSLALGESWKKKRISAKTVEKIRSIAKEQGYNVNRQARALRQAKSGITGMILPETENRFFSEMSQAFASEARQRSLCPAIIFSNREINMQLESLKNLIAFSVDFIVIAGATEPAKLSSLCHANGIPHVFVDQPYENAPSIISDNFDGAKSLTRDLIKRAEILSPTNIPKNIYFIGGEENSYATINRIEGFKSELTNHKIQSNIITCGYDAFKAYEAIKNIYSKLGCLPHCLFINSIICFEGIIKFLAEIPEKEISNCTIGCYDYDPLATVLRFPISMIHQQANDIVQQAFTHYDNKNYSASLTKIKTKLIKNIRSNQ